MKFSPKPILFILVILCGLALLTFSASSENQKWDCPECGRTGNTGNYCGGCAHPAPWLETTTAPPTSTPSPTPKPTSTPTPTSKPLNITSVSRENDNEVMIRWEGGTGQISVLTMHYFNDNYNDGIDVCYKNDWWWNTSQNGSGTIGNIVPGQRYWIKLTDTTGKSVWFDYTDPMGEEPDVKVSLKSINFSSYGKNGFHSVSGINAAKIEKTCSNSPNYDESQSQILIAANISIGKLKEPRQIDFSWALVLPNGDVVDSCIGFGEYVERGGGWIQNTGINWDSIYDAYGSIPTGKYTYYFGVGRYFVASKTFQLR